VVTHGILPHTKNSIMVASDSDYWVKVCIEGGSSSLLNHIALMSFVSDAIERLTRLKITYPVLAEPLLLGESISVVGNSFCRVEKHGCTE
jgi:hypothetical protein